MLNLQLFLAFVCFQFCFLLLLLLFLLLLFLFTFCCYCQSLLSLANSADQNCNLITRMLSIAILLLLKEKQRGGGDSAVQSLVELVLASIF